MKDFFPISFPFNHFLFSVSFHTLFFFALLFPFILGHVYLIISWFSFIHSNIFRFQILVCYYHFSLSLLFFFCVSFVYFFLRALYAYLLTASPQMFSLILSYVSCESLFYRITLIWLRIIRKSLPYLVTHRGAYRRIMRRKFLSWAIHCFQSFCFH